MTIKDEALKLALVEINRLCETGKITGATIETITAVEAALEANDGPVGVVATDTSKTHLYYGTQYLGQKTDTKMVMLFKDLPLGTPVYANPPQRKPLTDEQVDAIWPLHTFIQAPDRQWLAFARAIEAAHGIKGEA